MVASITQIADEFDRIVQRFNSVDSLSQETKDISVAHARDILEKLRFKPDGEESDAQLLDIDETRQNLMEALLQAAKAFLGTVADIIRSDPEKKATQEITPVFEKTMGAFGKTSYRVRIEIINQLIKQGKSSEAAAMRAKLEADTPQKFKAMEVPLIQLLDIIKSGLTNVELIEKRIAAGLQSQQWQNMPPPPPLKKPVKLSIKDKVMAALFSHDHTVVSSQISGVSESALIPAAQKINELPDPLVHHGVGYKVAGVNKEELVSSAKKANEETLQVLDPMANLKR